MKAVTAPYQVPRGREKQVAGEKALEHHETELCSPSHRFGPTVRIELGENGGDVKLSGVEGDSQPTCDRFIPLNYSSRECRIEVGQGSSGLLWRQGPSLCGSTIERGSRIWLAELTPETRDRVASRQHSDHRISQVEKCERRAH